MWPREIAEDSLSEIDREHTGCCLTSLLIEAARWCSQWSLEAMKAKRPYQNLRGENTMPPRILSLSSDHLHLNPLLYRHTPSPITCSRASKNKDHMPFSRFPRQLHKYYAQSLVRAISDPLSPAYISPQESAPLPHKPQASRSHDARFFSHTSNGNTRSHASVSPGK